jgi:trehalose 6-phosphate synthase/phosphatase
VIISGRDRGFLEKIFISQGFQFSLVACHGAYFYDAQLKKWEKWISEPHYDWKDEVINTMESFCQRTPGSFLEIKEQSIVWHFRNSPSEFASTISQKLFYDLQDFYQNKPLKVSRGKKIIEVHPKDLGKGKFLETWLRKSPSPTTQYFALGDDQTDEDMFEFLQNHPEISSYCIKVGPGQSKANYQISDQAEVEVFLNYLSQNYEEYSP